MLDILATFPGELVIPISRHSYGTASTNSVVQKQHINLAMGILLLGDNNMVLTVPEFILGRNLSAGTIGGAHGTQLNMKSSDDLFFQHICQNAQKIIEKCPTEMKVTLLYVDMLRLNRDMKVLKERVSRLEGVGAIVRFMRQFMGKEEMAALIGTLIKEQLDEQNEALGNHIDAAKGLRSGLDDDDKIIQRRICNAAHAIKGEMSQNTPARTWLVGGAKVGEDLKKIMSPIIGKEEDYITSTLSSIRDAKTEKEIRTIASGFVKRMRADYKGVIKSRDLRVGCCYARMTDTESRETIELNNCNHSSHQSSMAKAYFDEKDEDEDFTAPSSIAVISATHCRHIVSFDELRDSYVMVCVLVALGQLSDLVTTLTPRLSCIENLVEFVLCLCEDTQTQYHQSWGYGIDPREVAKSEAERVKKNENSFTKRVSSVDISGDLAEAMRKMSTFEIRHVDMDDESEEMAEGGEDTKPAAKKTRS